MLVVRRALSEDLDDRHRLGRGTEGAMTKHPGCSQTLRRVRAADIMPGSRDTCRAK